MINVKEELEKMEIVSGRDAFHPSFNDIWIEPESILAIMINEVVPADPMDDFYGSSEAAYLTTTIPLFQKAGFEVNSVQEILEKGIYITNAIKMPKTDTTVDTDSIERSLPYLEKELSLFPNVKVLMLMGDVAKKAFNRISKKESRRNAIPSVSTYKIRNSEIYYEGLRLMPSYIMTGQNLLIEKSKFQMASEDIAKMYQIIKVGM